METEGNLLHDAWESGDYSKLSFDQRASYFHGLNLKDKILEYAAENGLGGYSEEWREKRVWLTRNKEKLLSGRFDWMVRGEEGKMIVVGDWKGGWAGALPADQNWQLLELAVIIFVHEPQVEKIMVTLIQPKLPEEEQLSWHIYTRKDLMRETHALIKHLHQVTTEVGLPYKAGPYCTWCDAINICPLLKAMTDEFMPTSRKLAELNEFPTMEEIASFKPIRARMEAREQLAKKALAEDSRVIPGLYLKPTGFQRIVDSGVLGQILVDHLLPGDRPLVSGAQELLQHVKITLGAVEALVRSKDTGMKGKGLKEYIDELVAPAVTTKEKSPSLQVRR